MAVIRSFIKGEEMRKLFIIFLGIIMLTGCSSTLILYEESEPVQESSDEIDSTIDKPSYLYVDMPQLERKRQRMYHIEWGHFTIDTGLSSVTIFSEEQTDQAVLNEVYMAVDLDGTILTYEMGQFDKYVIQNGDLYIADLDSDGYDEIIYSGEVSNNGGTVSKVYQIKNGQIELMEDLNEEESNTSKYGYTYEFVGNKKIEIANQYTGDEWIKDISGLFEFDETGKPLSDGMIFFTSYESQVMPNIANDGTVTLCYYQYARAHGPDILGYTVTSLKYNQETKGFDVIETKFIEDQYMYNR